MSAASLKAAGAEVVAATSSDPRFPAGAAIDGDEKTFWLTTGLFPQELVIALPKTQSLTQIRTRTRSAKKLSVLRCDKPLPSSFEPLVEMELPEPVEPRALQVEAFQVQGVAAKFLKLIIHSAYEDFVAVHSIDVDAKPSL